MLVRVNDDSRDTYLGSVMFEADRVLKSYGLGQDTVSGRFLHSDLPGFKNLVDAALDSPAINGDVWSRFWFHARSVKTHRSDDALIIDEARVGVRTETERLEGGQLVEDGTAHDPNAEAFAQFATDNYSDFSVREPIFAQLEQTLRLLVVADWLRSAHVVPELDWMGRQQEAAFPMPATTPALSVDVTRTATRSDVEETVQVHLFGGVDFVDLHNVSSDDPSVGDTLRDAIATTAGSDSSADFLIDTADGQFQIAAVPVWAPRKKRVEVTELTHLPIPHDADLVVLARAAESSDFPAPNAGDRVIALPRLRSFNPDGADGVDVTVELGSVRAHERVMALYDADGAALGLFGKYAPATDADGWLEAERLDASDSRWRLLTKENDLIHAVDPDGREIVFDLASGLVVTEARKAGFIDYIRESDTGRLVSIAFRPTGGDDTPLATIAYADGNRQLAIMRKSDGELNQLAAKSNYPSMTVTAENAGGETFQVTLDGATGAANVDPNARGLDYVHRHGHEITRLLSEEPDFSIVPDGDATIVVRDGRIDYFAASIILEPTNFATALRERFPDEARLAGIERTDDGRVAVLIRSAAGDYRMDVVSPQLATTSVAGDDAVHAFREFEKRSNRMASKTDELTFVSFFLDGDRVTVQRGADEKTFPLTEVTAATADDAGADNAFLAYLAEAKTDIVIYRPAEERNLTPAAREALRLDSMPICAALSRYLGTMGIHVFADDERRIAFTNWKALKLRILKSVTDLVGMSTSGFGAADAQDIDDALAQVEEEVHVRRVVDARELYAYRNVLVVSAHNDADLAAFLRDLGEQGLLNGRILFLNTCYTGSNANSDLFHELISIYNATAVLHHGDAIKPVALRYVIPALWDQIRSMPPNGVHPADLFRRAADAVLQGTVSDGLKVGTDLPDALQQEIKKLMKSFLMLSREDISGAHGNQQAA